MIRILLVLTVLAAAGAVAQFTKITDPANPVVNDQFESGGGTWIDVNGDGYPDLFVSNGNLSNQNNTFYINDQNGGFIKVATGAIVTDGGSSIGSTWGDFNSDGRIDCFVTNRANFGNFLYTGQGDSAFTKVLAGGVVTDIANSNSSSWVDLDGDGNLDLYVVNFQGNDYYYHNNGSPTFDFTRIDTLLPVLDGANFSISGSWTDYNNDRRPDLFVGNAGTQSDDVYRNDGNYNFTRILLVDGKASVGHSWGDYDNDGALDLFVANTLNQNNVLYHNSGAPSYNLSAVGTGVVSNDGGNSVGSAWGDYDNDGDLDLFVGNDGGNNALYRNDGPPNYTFTKITSGAIVNDGGNSFGAVWGDYDRDGFLDLFVANRLNQKNFLYHNDGNGNHWLKFLCQGTVSNPTAIGAKVRVKATINGLAVWQLREIQSQSGYNSENLAVHFGLGDAVTADSVIVEWPSGATDYYLRVRADRFETIVEGVPPAPVLLAASPANNALRLRWEQCTASSFDHYDIAVDTLPGPVGVTATVLSVGDTALTVSGLINDRPYHVRLRVVNDSAVAGPWSNELVATPVPILDQEVSVSSKWNIVSLRLRPVAPALGDIFPTASSAAFSFAGLAGYQPADSLRPGIGYWLKFPSAQSVMVSGYVIAAETILVSQGWNMVGSLSTPVAVADLASDPPAIITSQFFGYDQGYLAADTIRPGKGYWVKTDQAGSLILSANVAAANAARIVIRADAELPPAPPGEVVRRETEVPHQFRLGQNYPNPFNPSTVIEFDIARPGFVRLRVYDILGRTVGTLVNESVAPGRYAIPFDAGRLSGGIYYYRLEADGVSAVKKMVLSR